MKIKYQVCLKDGGTVNNLSKGRAYSLSQELKELGLTVNIKKYYEK